MATKVSPPSSLTMTAPRSVGIFGGSFNPIHLGHVLLAVTSVQQTNSSIDQVVLVPVYKHAVKRNLLPFEDRVRMCELAIENFASSSSKSSQFPIIAVSTIEKKVGASNGAMIEALKKEYPSSTKFYWICGDDFFQWWTKPKGLETLEQIDGLIMQRRLHRSGSASSEQEHFYKQSIDPAEIAQVARQYNIHVHELYGELPHFSSTLVRRAPGNWRSFLTSAVASYLDEKPHLVQQLLENLQLDTPRTKADKETDTTPTTATSHSRAYNQATAIVLKSLEIVHVLQLERGNSALFLTLDDHQESLSEAQRRTDIILEQAVEIRSSTHELDNDFDETKSLALELDRIPYWLKIDRKILQKKSMHNKLKGRDESSHEMWLLRWDLLQKFNSRIDVLMGGTNRALTEILQQSRNECVSSVPRPPLLQQDARIISELFQTWCEGKEALGRERAFVCAGGALVPKLVRTSYSLREHLLRIIDEKERKLARVFRLEATLPSQIAAPKALHHMLEELTKLEYAITGCFSNSTPLTIIHHVLETNEHESTYDCLKFFNSSTAAIDFLLNFAKALAATACASA